MPQGITYVGLDAHKESIFGYVLLPSGAPGSAWTIPYTAKDVQKMVKRLVKEAPGEVRFCYEAGVCGFSLQRQIEKLGAKCAVIAPSLIPRKPGDRIKTDRRDARKLAEYLSQGMLTEVSPPTEAEEAARDLCRALWTAKGDRLRHKHRLDKMLVKLGYKVLGMKMDSRKYAEWLKALAFDDANRRAIFEAHVLAIQQADEQVKALAEKVEELAKSEAYREAVGHLRCFRGLDTVSAITLVTELHRFGRFESPRKLMAYLGLTPSEYSSGGSQKRGGITKTGNGHARRVLVEASWLCRHKPQATSALRKRRAGQPAWAIAIAQKAATRLHRRFHRLANRGMPRTKVAIAVAREFAGFVWAAMRPPETQATKA